MKVGRTAGTQSSEGGLRDMVPGWELESRQGLRIGSSEPMGGPPPFTSAFLALPWPAPSSAALPVH